METNAQRLLANVKSLISQHNIPNAEKYEANVVAFLNQCPDDVILEDTKVVWDNNEGEFDFLWDTAHLDCRFSVGLEDTRWHLWAGINNHKQDDECYQNGVGGEEIDGNDSFAYSFFDHMKWEIVTCGRR